MTFVVRVHFLPTLFAPAEVAGGTVVVIDILRASTTIVRALAEGARAVWPCLAVDDALAVRERLKADSPPAVPEQGSPTAIELKEPPEPLLGGERHGLIIPGFDLGNSPLDYTPARVAGRDLVFTTTNGTVALLRGEQAAELLVGAFVNQTAIVRRLATGGRPVHLVCAGTDGHFTGEDILFAGSVASELREQGVAEILSDDISTRLAIDHARSIGNNPAAIHATLRASRGGKNLLEHGFDADIQYAASRDLHTQVPTRVSDRGSPTCLRLTTR